MRRPLRWAPRRVPRFNLNEIIFGPAAPDNQMVDEPEPDPVVWEMNDMMRRSTKPPRWKRKRDWEA